MYVSTRDSRGSPPSPSYVVDPRVDWFQLSINLLEKIHGHLNHYCQQGLKLLGYVRAGFVVNSIPVLIAVYTH